VKMHWRLKKIISGGQTGADRAGLDFAIAHGIAHGGWCPQGRLAEDGMIDWRYRLKETPSPAYAQRTEWNVRDAEGTVIFSLSKNLVGGSKLTEELTRRYGRPCLHLSKMRTAKAAEKLEHFFVEHKIGVLNIAGPRALTEPEVGVFVKAVLEAWWKCAKISKNARHPHDC